MIETRTLEARIASACVALAPEMRLGRVELDVAESYVTEELLFRLKAYVYSERFASTIQVPLNWAEAVKERFAPAWLQKRFPVKYRDLKAEMFAAYPEFKPAQGLGPCVRHYEVSAMGLFPNS